MLTRTGDFALNVLIGMTMVMAILFLGLAVTIMLLPHGHLP